ncbi:MAG: trypsin-like peptidase domain-containing protein, partial [Verrucomicrobia bacterium]|nr:trypsin-like peptidase domain-containing protein [Verrucomicrobiota bacterium]
MKSFLRFLIFVLLLTLAISLLYIWQVKQPVLRTESQKVTLAEGPLLESGSVPLLERLSNEYTALAQAVVPSVVSITTTKTVVQPRFLDPFELFFRRFSHSDPNTQKVSILGSGAIVSKEGHIITNDHVVSGTDEILVQLHDGRKARARLVGSDAQIDLAVLKIDLDNLSPINLADSDDVKVGQLVFAIGSPFGLEGSVSQGIISAKGRRALSENSLEYFQTDTAINPGNSGGPLVDVHGRMVGMNTAIYSESGGNQGIGFAIPSNVVSKALVSLIQHGRIVHGYLGVSIEPVTQDLADRMNLASTSGALITKVTTGSPAEKAGLQKGDVILKVDGKELRDSSTLSQYLGQIEVGDNLALEISRSGT